MGCDIHSISQYKDPFCGWVTKTLHVGDDQRNYDSFAVMADVRNNGEWTPIAEARYLPEDTEEILALNYDLGEHSRSYLTLFEIERAIKKLSKRKGNLLASLPYLIAVEKELFIVAELTKSKPKDVRIVFGFDS